MKELLLGAVLLGNMTITSYRSERRQTDDTPFITATGEHVHSAGIALSRDLLKRWNGSVDYGDIVYVENFGFKIVNDCMGRTKCAGRNNGGCKNRIPIKKSVDMWVATLEEEKKVGVRHGKVWLIKYAELRGNKQIVK